MSGRPHFWVGEQKCTDLFLPAPWHGERILACCVSLKSFSARSVFVDTHGLGSGFLRQFGRNFARLYAVASTPWLTFRTNKPLHGDWQRKTLDACNFPELIFHIDELHTHFLFALNIEQIF